MPSVKNIRICICHQLPSKLWQRWYVCEGVKNEFGRKVLFENLKKQKRLNKKKTHNGTP